LHASYRSLHRGPFIFGPAFFAAEKLLRVPDSRAHQTSLARRCSGHDEYHSGCVFWQLYWRPLHWNTSVRFRTAKRALTEAPAVLVLRRGTPKL